MSQGQIKKVNRTQVFKTFTREHLQKMKKVWQVSQNKSCNTYNIPFLFTRLLTNTRYGHLFFERCVFFARVCK